MLWATNQEIKKRFYSETLSDEEMDFYLQQQAEIHAEYAWLRAAESPTNDDLAFEAYEARMGLI